MTACAGHSSPRSAAGRSRCVGLVILVCDLHRGRSFAPLLAPYDPSRIEPVARLLPPSAAHWFGTDQFGRDTLSRVIYGTRLALLIGVGVVSFALVTGVPAGVFSALFPRVGRIVMRMIDVLMSFPALLLALGLIVILGRGVTNAILAIGVVYLTTTSRITYGLDACVCAPRPTLRPPTAWGPARSGRSASISCPT